MEMDSLMTSDADKKLITITAQKRRFINQAVEIRESEPEQGDKAFITRFMVQATLPHRAPQGNPPTWTRANGHYTLRIRPGYVTDPRTREDKCVGYPFGSIPRLLMFWMNTEALKTGSRKLCLGGSLTGFMRSIGLNPDNGGTGAKRSDARRLRDQMERLFLATISFEYSTVEARRWKDMAIAPEGELWWNPKTPDQAVFWDSWIELGEKFYEAIIDSPVPVDIRAIRALKNSPLALDLYAWATYKTFILSQKHKSQHISWHQLQAQIGASYKDSQDFRYYAKEALRKIITIYPGIRIKDSRDGLIISPGKTTVAPAIPKLIP